MMALASRSSLNCLFAAALLFATVVLLGADDKPAPTTQRKETDLELFEEGTVWNFTAGEEFPGAKGSVKLGQEQGKPVGILTYDFSGGGNYVAAATEVQIPETVSELRFKVQAKEAAQILVRLTDQSGQVHHWILPYTQAGQWSTLRVSLRKPAAIHWEGKNDGVIYYPVGKLLLGVESTNLTTKQGQVLFTDVITLEKKPS
jgi:hypothetical protein